MARGEADWLALCLASESNQPHEWPAVGWVIRNRVSSKRFPDTYREVALQPKQFSYFNVFHGDNPEMIFDLAMGNYAGKLFPAALSCASAILEAPPWRAPFGPGVLWYWSPVSMVPKGSAPPWAAKADRTFTPSGIDPRRFVMAEGIP